MLRKAQNEISHFNSETETLAPKENNLRERESMHQIVEKTKKLISIPVIVKIGKGFSNIPGLVNRMYFHGAKGVVLFNRYYSPGIDIRLHLAKYSEMPKIRPCTNAHSL